MNSPLHHHTPFDRRTPSLPMHYPGFVFRTLCKDGFSGERLLAGTDLSAERLADPYFRTDFSTIRRFILNALECTGDPHLGPRLARRFDPTYVGLPAFAAMSASSFRDALEVLYRFMHLTFPVISFSWSQGTDGLHADEAAIRLRPKLPLEDVAYFVCGSALIVCDGLLKAILRASQVATRVDTTISEPEGWSAIAPEVTRVPVRFAAREDRVIVSADLLERSLPAEDPINHKRLVMLCERFAADVGGDASVVGQIVALLRSRRDCAAPLAEAAAALGCSERTLRRQLERAGTSYRELVNQIREERARDMLAATARPVKEIAIELGYDNPSNFVRSFKRWTGLTPKAFRDSLNTNGSVAETD